MTRLIKVELSRLLARRLFRLVVVLGLLGVLVIDGLLAANSSNNVAAAQAHAKAQLQQAYQGCLHDSGLPNGPSKADCQSMLPAGQVTSCLSQVGQPGNDMTAAECRSVASDPFFNDPRFHFARHAADLLTGAAFILLALGLVVAASSVGAEWQAGTFASLLTWEPRRQRVLLAKLLAPVIGVTVLSAVAISLLLSGAAVAADARGTLDGTTQHLVGQLAVMGLRVLGLVALVSLIGAALATLTRSTIGVVGIVAGYLVAGELVGSLVSTWWRFHGLSAHLLAFIRGTVTFSLGHRTATGEAFTDHTLHAAGSSVLVVVIAAVAVAVASAVLSRRDVA